MGVRDMHLAYMGARGDGWVFPPFLFFDTGSLIIPVLGCWPSILADPSLSVPFYKNNSSGPESWLGAEEQVRLVQGVTWF